MSDLAGTTTEAERNHPRHSGPPEILGRPAASSATRGAADAAPATVGVARATFALAAALARFVPAGALHADAQLVRWQRCAAKIEDAEQRTLALAKLHGERFNAEAAAVMATGAPVAYRRPTAEAILALEVMFDYLDGITELPLADPLADGERLFGALEAALPASGAGGLPSAHPPDRAGGATSAHPAEAYLAELRAAAHTALSQLPAWEAVAPAARRCARRGAQAQTRMHAAATLGAQQVRQWAQAEAQAIGMGWRETLAGCACAVLALHALAVAAANPETTTAEAERIEAAYLPLCAIITLLDGIADAQCDSAEGRRSYAAHYADDEQLGRALADLAARARNAFADLPDAPRHTAVLAAALAYSLTAAGAQGGHAATLLAPMRGELGSLLTPPLLVMRAWRRRAAASQVLQQSTIETSRG